MAHSLIYPTNIESLLWAVLEAGEIAINEQKYVCPEEGKVSKPNIKAIGRRGEKEHGKGLAVLVVRAHRDSWDASLTKRDHKGSEGKWKKNLPERRFSECKGPDDA